MSLARNSSVQVVRAAYDLSGTESEWLKRIASAIRPMIDGLGMGSIGYQLSAHPPLFDFGIEVGSEGIVDQFLQMDPSQEMAQTIIRMMLEPSAAFLSSELWAQVSDNEAYRRIALLDVPNIDVLMLRIRHIDSNGITVIASPNPVGTNLSSRQRVHLGMLCSHIAAGLRLRRRWTDLDTAPLDLGDEGVLFDEGEKLVATQGVTPEAGQALSAAVHHVTQVRNGQVGDDKALELWRGLLAGRYSVVHTTDTDGKRFIVVRANPSEIKDPRGLSKQQARIAATAALGYSNKQIAYELGVSDATVATHLRRAIAKLGLANRTELARVIGPLAEHLKDNGLKATD